MKKGSTVHDGWAKAHPYEFFQNPSVERMEITARVHLPPITNGALLKLVADRSGVEFEKWYDQWQPGTL